MTTNQRYVLTVTHSCTHRVVHVFWAPDREEAERLSAWPELRPCEACQAEWLRKTSEAERDA